MTIRDHLKRRVYIGYGLLVLAWVWLFTLQPTEFRSDQPDPMFFIGFVPFVAAFLWLSFGIRCPRCTGNLAAMPIVSPFSRKRRLNYCPFCGVHVDESVKAAA